ncbi:hypothetical protein VTJ04DRAFT_29 [Mycothermus thermophilus]|uniref:uncharacterized protein n=1 Tax=Humicola insolens TaxID=85995 RepID=UPI0037426377
MGVFVWSGLAVRGLSDLNASFVCFFACPRVGRFGRSDRLRGGVLCCLFLVFPQPPPIAVLSLCSPFFYCADSTSCAGAPLCFPPLLFPFFPFSFPSFSWSLDCVFLSRGGDYAVLGHWRLESPVGDAVRLGRNGIVVQESKR